MGHGPPAPECAPPANFKLEPRSLPPPSLPVDALEVDEFTLLLKQLKYDQAVHETWQRKCRTIYGAREHAKQEMKLNRRKKAMDTATLFLNKCSKLTLWEPQRPEVTVGEIMDFRRTPSRAS